MIGLAFSIGLSNTNTNTNTMPNTLPILWYCCKCSFGPHNPAVHDACINCGNRRCGMCMDEKVAHHSNPYSQDHHETSPYPSLTALSTAHTLSLDTSTGSPLKATEVESPQTPSLSRPEYTTLPSQPGISQSYSRTYMYICCNCQDGPKVYDVQPVCVMCNHKVCSSCTYVK